MQQIFFYLLFGFASSQHASASGGRVQTTGPFGTLYSYVHPRPNAFFVSPFTTIALRAFETENLRNIDITVAGEQRREYSSGKRSLSSNQQTFVFTPAAPFQINETVTVTVKSGGGSVYSWSFQISPKPLTFYRSSSEVFVSAKDDELTIQSIKDFEKLRATKTSNFRPRRMQTTTTKDAIQQSTDNADEETTVTDQESSSTGASTDELTDELTGELTDQDDLTIGVSNTISPLPWYVTLPHDFPKINATVIDGPISPGYILSSNVGYPRDLVSPYLLITKNNGDPVWYKKLRPEYGWTITDFSYQPKRESLTYHSSEIGTYVELDNHYQEIRHIYPGHRHHANPHGLQLEKDGSALMMIYESEFLDLTGYAENGQDNARVVGAIVQEIDPQGFVIFEWRSWDYLPTALNDTLAPHTLSKPYVDHLHINSIDWTSDGNYLFGFRHLNQVMKVSKEDGKVMWRVGGPGSDFDLQDRPFSHQHDARLDEHNVLSLFDNGNTADEKVSRSVRYQLNEEDMTATKIWEKTEPLDRFAFATGSTRLHKNGNVGISWGGVGKPTKLPFYSEVTPEGETLVSLEFVNPQSSYRSTKIEWKGYPVEPPILRIRYDGEKSKNTNLHFSWNGATEVDHWKIYGGLSRYPSELLDTVYSTGKFEERVTFPSVADRCYFYQVEAFTIDGESQKSNPAFAGYWGVGEC